MMLRWNPEKFIKQRSHCSDDISKTPETSSKHPEGYESFQDPENTVGSIVKLLFNI